MRLIYSCVIGAVGYEGSAGELANSLFYVEPSCLGLEVLSEAPVVPKALTGSVVDDFQFTRLLPIFQGCTSGNRDPKSATAAHVIKE